MLMMNTLEYTGVESITVSLENETADVVYQAELITEEDLIAQIEDMGFEASRFVSNIYKICIPFKKYKSYHY